MATWIEVKVRYNKLMSDGAVKKVTEAYLVDALSCTEAEARVIDELRPFVSGDLRVTSVTTTKIAEIFRDGAGDRFYKVKVNFITIDEKTAAEKKTASYILVEASGFKEAYANFEDGMRGTLADYEIEQLCETKLVDVYEADMTSAPEAETIARDPEVRQHAKAFVDACAEGGVTTVTMTASDGKDVLTTTIDIPDNPRHG